MKGYMKKNLNYINSEITATYIINRMNEYASNRIASSNVDVVDNFRAMEAELGKVLDVMGAKYKWSSVDNAYSLSNIVYKIGTDDGSISEDEFITINEAAKYIVSCVEDTNLLLECECAEIPIINKVLENFPYYTHEFTTDRTITYKIIERIKTDE